MEDLSNTVNNECQELKNIKYKTMLLNGVQIHETKSSNDLSNLDKFLENEKNNNINEPWCKLNKTVKTKKIQDFVEIYKVQNELSDEESGLLTTFLKDCLDRKKLQRVKDVIYDKETGFIKQIPALYYVKANKHFTLKNVDKRVSTLKSLAPKKSSQGTIRKKEINKNSESDSEEDDEN
jgi:hypothetical protein